MCDRGMSGIVYRTLLCAALQALSSSLFDLLTHHSFSSTTRLFQPWKRKTQSSTPLHLLQRAAHRPISCCHWWALWVDFWTAKSKQPTGTEEEASSWCGVDPSTSILKILHTQVQYRVNWVEDIWAWDSSAETIRHLLKLSLARHGYLGDWCQTHDVILGHSSQWLFKSDAAVFQMVPGSSTLLPLRGRVCVLSPEIWMNFGLLHLKKYYNIRVPFLLVCSYPLPC